MLTAIQKIFLLSTVNNQPNFQEQLPVQGREWPRDGWLTQRLAYIRAKGAAQDDTETMPKP